eukprot:Sspe_Gene.53014::Locus_29337_Transcript_1_1_Confidence_1.000_Length_5136::g.53014::m.53014
MMLMGATLALRAHTITFETATVRAALRQVSGARGVAVTATVFLGYTSSVARVRKEAGARMTRSRSDPPPLTWTRQIHLEHCSTRLVPCTAPHGCPHSSPSLSVPCTPRSCRAVWKLPPVSLSSRFTSCRMSSSSSFTRTKPWHRICSVGFPKSWAIPVTLHSHALGSPQSAHASCPPCMPHGPIATRAFFRVISGAQDGLFALSWGCGSPLAHDDFTSSSVSGGMVSFTGDPADLHCSSIHSNDSGTQATPTGTGTGKGEDAISWTTRGRTGDSSLSFPLSLLRLLQSNFSSSGRAAVWRRSLRSESVNPRQHQYEGRAISPCLGGSTTGRRQGMGPVHATIPQPRTLLSPFLPPPTLPTPPMKYR